MLANTEHEAYKKIIIFKVDTLGLFKMGWAHLTFLASAAGRKGQLTLKPYEEFGSKQL